MAMTNFYPDQIVMYVIFLLVVLIGHLLGWWTSRRFLNRRDILATKVLVAFIQNPAVYSALCDIARKEGLRDVDAFSRAAYELADAMSSERFKRRKK